MMTIAMHAASLLLPLVVMAQAVSGVGELRDPRPAGWVVDQAEVVDDTVERELDASLAALHAEVGPQVVLVAVHDVPGTPKAFATELFNTWQLGSREKNDGVLVLMVVKQRRLEIETGDGLQAVLSAAWLSELQRREMVPAFKRGDLSGGLRAGVAGLAARLRQPPGEQDAPDAPGAYRSDGELVRPGEVGDPGARGAAATRPALGDGAADAPPSSPPPPAADRPFLEGKGGQGLLGLLATGGLVGGGTYWRRRRNRRCKKCGLQRDILDEVADDAHLSAGERAEEKVGSVDHVILHCPTCETFEHQKRNAIFSRRRTCEGCKHRTAITTTSVIRSPTYSSTGLAEVAVSCSFCPHSSRSRHTLARLTRSSSSSSGGSSSSSRSSYGSSSSSRSSSSSSSRSSSGSSGGGRSSGGGSGSSW